MKRVWIPALFCSAGICAGLAVVMLESSEVAQSPSSAPAAAQNQQDIALGFSHYTELWSGKGAPHPAPAAVPRIEHLWAEALRNANTVGSTAQAQLRHAAQEDKAVLTELLRKYEAEQDHNARGVLRSTLIGIQKPEVLQFALKLTESSDPLYRSEGFALLGQLPIGDKESRQAVMKSLNVEQDPAVLRQAINSIKPSTATPLEISAVTAKLHQLSEHPEVDVRRQSLMMLRQWDRSANMEGRIKLALADQAYVVRLTAMYALNDPNLRTDSIKQALLEIARGDDTYSKHAAAQALGKFNLTREESELQKQVLAQLEAR